MRKLKMALLVFMGCMLAGSAVAQELTLFTMPAPRKIDWSSPRSLLTSAVTNNLTFQHRSHKHAIGHVFIQLSHEGRKELIMP